MSAGVVVEAFVFLCVRTWRTTLPVALFCLSGGGRALDGEVASFVGLLLKMLSISPLFSGAVTS